MAPYALARDQKLQSVLNDGVANEWHTVHDARKDREKKKEGIVWVVNYLHIAVPIAITRKPSVLVLRLRRRRHRHF